MAMPQLYKFEQEIVVDGDSEESDFASYVGASSPAAVFAAVQVALKKLKVINLTCPASIRADTADGVTLKVTLKR